ncbi:MAG: SIS domain-containing protein [Clostridia bacterium]|nr:SIS domain-containing protein [Clostridia bacterium]
MKELFERYPQLEVCRESLEKALSLMLETYRKGGKILLCGNGGSCADCDHIVGELMKGFLSMRPATEEMKNKFVNECDDGEYIINNLQRGIPAISLPAQSAVLSAFINDVQPDLMYAQLVYGYAKENDLVVGLSTSGNSGNVVNAVKTAKTLGVNTLSLTGAKDSKLSEISTCTIKVPETETFKIQELHLPVYHWLCAEIERILFG